MQCPACGETCELTTEVVDIGLELRRLWKADGQVGFSRLGDDVNK